MQVALKIVKKVEKEAHEDGKEIGKWNVREESCFSKHAN
jgi:hypothetical protein